MNMGEEFSSPVLFPPWFSQARGKPDCQRRAKECSKNDAAESCKTDEHPADDWDKSRNAKDRIGDSEIQRRSDAGRFLKIAGRTNIHSCARLRQSKDQAEWQRQRWASR
jgi:hypothetical protein